MESHGGFFRMATESSKYTWNGHDTDWFKQHGVTALQDVKSMSSAQVDAALAAFQDKPDSKNGHVWNWFQELQAQKGIYDQQAAMSEYMAQMGEYLAGMTEALQTAAAEAGKVTPYNEVLKQAPGASAEAQTETARRQSLRRGLMSTFSTLGGGTKLGGSDF